METTESKKWKMWRAVLDIKTCFKCREKHGKIYEINEKVKPSPPLHWFCRCEIVRLKAILAGNATKLGTMGADWWLKHYGKLPDYYISITDADLQGWRREEGNLGKVAPGKMITGGIYQNKNGHLPSAPGRIWYEADLNYSSGYRGTDRIVYSIDGLIFVTYDHYKTFLEIK